jgi:hypothetical protein
LPIPRAAGSEARELFEVAGNPPDAPDQGRLRVRSEPNNLWSGPAFTNVPCRWIRSGPVSEHAVIVYLIPGARFDLDQLEASLESTEMP